jgi:hypothetical protein
MKRCDMGGDYWYPQIPGPAVYKEPCRQSPTHRYRVPGMVEGHWGYRCAQHVTILNAPGLIIEPLTGGTA